MNRLACLLGFFLAMLSAANESTTAAEMLRSVSRSVSNPTTQPDTQSANSSSKESVSQPETQPSSQPAPTVYKSVAELIHKIPQEFRPLPNTGWKETDRFASDSRMQGAHQWLNKEAKGAIFNAKLAISKPSIHRAYFAKEGQWVLNIIFTSKTFTYAGMTYITRVQSQSGTFTKYGDEAFARKMDKRIKPGMLVEVEGIIDRVEMNSFEPNKTNITLILKQSTLDLSE